MIGVQIIDNYCDKIVACLKSAAQGCLNTRSSGSNYSKYVIPGWNKRVYLFQLVIPPVGVPSNFLGLATALIG